MVRAASVLAAALVPVVILLSQAAGVGAQQLETEAPRSVTIGYVELEDDARYRAQGAYTGIVHRTLGRPLPGAEVGIGDARTIGRVIDTDFSLEHVRAASVKALASTVSTWVHDRDVHFVLADLPAEELLLLADRVADLPVLLFNVSAPDDALRGSACRRNIAHTYPSTSMLTDALTQYLVSKNWRDVLVLQGPSDEDSRTVDAMRRSAAKFGAEIVEERPFVLTTDPRSRNQNNVALITAGVGHDVVFVADSSGEFGRYVPYQTSLSRPVVGSAGLTPHAWHWSWHRHGAPQLQHRFEAAAMPRRMNSAAWAAWVAVKAVTQAALRANSTDFAEMQGFILGDAINLDGAKGNPMSFRAWNHQLRQPILLATAEAVIARAPVPEFVHRTNDLDTLGTEAPATACQF